MPDAGFLQDQRGVPARGGETHLDGRRPQVVDQGDGGIIEPGAIAGDDLVEDRVLLVTQAADGLGARQIIRRTRRQVDAAGFEKRGDALVARPAVDVAPVVALVGELAKRLVSPLRTLPEIVVEHLLPSPRVDGRRAGDHAIHVEDRRIESPGALAPHPVECASGCGRDGGGGGGNSARLERIQFFVCRRHGVGGWKIQPRLEELKRGGARRRDSLE